MEQNPATIVRDALEEHGKKISFLSSEVAVFKQALCSVMTEMNKSSDKMLAASRWYFWGNFLLTVIITVSTMIQSGLIKISAE